MKTKLPKRSIKSNTRQDPPEDNHNETFKSNTQERDVATTQINKSKKDDRRKIPEALNDVAEIFREIKTDLASSSTSKATKSKTNTENSEEEPKENKNCCDVFWPGHLIVLNVLN